MELERLVIQEIVASEVLLDNENERKILETIKQLGKEITYIIISH